MQSNFDTRTCLDAANNDGACACSLAIMKYPNEERRSYKYFKSSSTPTRQRCDSSIFYEASKEHKKI
ncbi:hypothetical protein PISMIDRAFT_590753 [Pisolithus microcarpus 441]|uniref:Uncharacterized protein n=1 Tax=Pisolithus microcarpus 441 TaxID=765257 RepID=A0A0D0A9K8_9AGAM|nr:hypothetical protein PISMIDRAFT_590753 [Pisolithus microcarpus 441]